MVKKIERVIHKLDKELIEELNAFKYLKSKKEIQKVFIGNLSDGREYKLEVFGVFRVKHLGLNFAEIGFKFEVENSDKDGLTHLRSQDLNSMLFNPMMIIPDGEQDILVVLDLSDYRKEFHLNQWKNQTNKIVDNGFSNEYFKALVLHSSFNNELEFAEVLMVYIVKKLKGDSFSKIEEIIKEKLEYYGFYDNLEIEADSPLVDHNHYENEVLKDICYIAFEILYLNLYSNKDLTGTFEDDLKEGLKIMYNEFHEEEIKKRFRATY